MKIIYINTSNKKVTRNMIIRKAIESHMQYVEMEDEVLINTDVIFRIIENISTYYSECIVDCLKDEKKECIPLIDNFYLKENISKTYTKNNKKQQKLQSQYVKNKIKQNKYLK